MATAGRVALGEDRDEDVGALELLLAGALHVHGRAADARWKPSESDGSGVGVLGQRRDLVVEELLELLLQRGRVAAGVADDLRRLVVEEQRVEQVLDRQVLVPPPRASRVASEKAISTSGLTRMVYSGSAVSRRGIPCSLA